MKQISILLFGALLFLSSCGPKINKTQQEELNVLTGRIDSIVNGINDIDSVALEKMVVDFFEKKDFIQNDIKDTIGPDIIFTLDAFMRLRKAMGFFQKEYSAIKQEANTMQIQMEDLNHDVNKRLIEEKQFEKYYVLEKENFDNLNRASTQLFNVFKRTNKSYHEQLPVIDSIIDSYKSKMNE